MKAIPIKAINLRIIAVQLTILKRIALRIIVPTICVYPLWAQTPLIKGVHADHSEYLAYINTHGGYKEYHKTEMNRSLPNDVQIEDLRFYLGQAQESYLNNDIDAAKANFKEVTDMAFTTDWEDEHRLAIFYSFLRRAQLEESKENRDKLITQAFEFDSHLQPDPKLFDKRIQSEFKRIKENYPWLLWLPKNLFQKYSLIKINGRAMNFSMKRIPLSQGLLRASLFSNSFQSQSVEMKGTEFINWEPSQSPLFRGSCTDGKGKSLGFPVYFSKHCIYNPQKEIELVDLKPQIDNSPQFPPIEVPKHQWGFLQNKWFWMGIAAFTFTIVNQKRKRKGRPPTQRQTRPSSHRGF